MFFTKSSLTILWKVAILIIVNRLQMLVGPVIGGVSAEAPFLYTEV